MKNFVEELRWRGILHDMIPGTEEQLNKEITAGYIGFDPTADSLHVGHMVQVMTLQHFQKAGHKPIALVGGATGMVGDPSGKSEERNLLSQEALEHNLKGIKAQLEKFLDFEAGENAAEIVNNHDWFKQFTFLDFIRDVGKHITVNYMMSKDSVKLRLSGEAREGMSFTEFCYQLIQGYDFYHLWKHHNVKLQMGGSDQWGNIVTGTELIRKKDGGDAFALTTKLLMKSDGSKFGKSESGSVWLDPAKTSPYKFYQFWLNASDEDATGLIRRFSLKEKEAIENIEREHFAAPHLRTLQKALAEEITSKVHGKEALEKAIDASEILFGKSTSESLKNLSNSEILDVFEGVPMFNFSKDKLGNTDTLSLLAEATKVFNSKGEARRSLQENAVSVNKEKVSAETIIQADQLLNGKFLIVQKGKKNYYLLSAE